MNDVNMLRAQHKAILYHGRMICRTCTDFGSGSAVVWPCPVDRLLNAAEALIKEWKAWIPTPQQMPTGPMLEALADLDTVLDGDSLGDRHKLP